MSLTPCPSCSRHVRRHEAACPFCGAAISLEGASPRRAPVERLGRAAIFTFGAAIATSGAACTGSVVPMYGAPIDAASGVDAASGADTGTVLDDSGTDAGQPMTLYGGPVLDDAAASSDDAGQPMTLYGGPVVDDAGGSSSDYGAPPAP